MNAAIEKLKEFLSRHQKFIISTHESPDGDGLGAEIAFRELLGHLGKTSMIINSDPVPDKFRFLDIDSEITIYNDSYVFPDDISDYGHFVLDTNDYDNIGHATYNAFKDRIKECFIIDHHEGDKAKCERNFVKVEASSASEIIYSIIRYFNKNISFKAAQAMYTGILFDTGSFRYPKTTPETFKVIAHLVEIGANPFKIYEHIYENNELSVFQLRALMLSSIETYYNGKMIVMKLTPEMVKKTGSPFSEGELNITLPLTVKGVVASVLVKQDIEGPVKVSMRTKGDYDVAEISLARGGGGHKNAAGYKSKLSFDETYKMVLDDMSRFFK
jgi:phosphoesterase RecJ-like protein